MGEDFQLTTLERLGGVYNGGIMQDINQTKVFETLKNTRLPIRGN